MTAERLAEIERRLHRATPGPWRWVIQGWQQGLYTDHSGRYVVMDFVRRGMRDAAPRFQAYVRYEGPLRERGSLGMKKAEEFLEDGYLKPIHPDAELIASAPTDIADLLAEVRRLRQCLEFLADETKLSAEHHNSHLWAYIVGEALQVDPKESPFWEPDDEVSP